MTSVVHSPAGQHISRINCLVSKEDCMDAITTDNLFRNLRSQAKTKCPRRVSNPDPNNANYECFDDYCLFDILQDPCEYQNVAAQNQQVLNMTVEVLGQYRREMVKQYYPKVDLNSNPQYFGGYWDTWMEKSGTASTGRHTYTIVLTCLLYFMF